MIRFCQTALWSVFTNLNYHWSAWKLLFLLVLKTVCQSIKYLPLWQAWSISVYFVCLSRLSVSIFLYAYCLYTVCTGHMHKHIHSLSIQLILKILDSYNKDTANSESSNSEQIIFTKGNTRLGSCVPLVTTFSSPINIKHIVCVSV